MSGAITVPMLGQLENNVKESTKNVNDISTILSAVDDKSLSMTAMSSLKRIFIFFAEKGDLIAKTSINQTKKNAKVKSVPNALELYHRFLYTQYEKFLSKTLAWLLSDSSNLQAHSLRVMIELISKGENLSGKEDHLDIELLQRMLDSLCGNHEINNELASIIKGELITPYADVQYYVLYSLCQVIEKRRAQETDMQSPLHLSFCRNVLLILSMIRLPKSDNKIKTFLFQPLQLSESNSEMYPFTTVEGFKQVFSSCWLAFLKLPLPQDVYRSVLLRLPKQVLPNLSNPLLLGDFLTDSYNLGGVSSILALNSLYILIQEHNFDYPDFYTKLYRLLEPTILYARYRERFFHHLELFLSSTHLPAYLIAAFAKRLSRLSLTAPTPALAFILQFVFNLIFRHKECIQLIHRVDSSTPAQRAAARREALNKQEMVENVVEEILKKESSSVETGIQHNLGEDVYIYQEQNPAKCRALESSLWEIFSLKHHYNASIAAMAESFGKSMRTSRLRDLEEAAETTYKSLYEKTIKRKCAVHLAFQSCKRLFQEDDSFARVF